MSPDPPRRGELEDLLREAAPRVLAAVVRRIADRGRLAADDRSDPGRLGAAGA
ncbi:MAG TPA: hypothetical protein VHV53_02040 [Solirubrobacterales bacterium]|nr:hypothetical protein [Solirubrobacterales bacterium]